MNNNNLSDAEWAKDWSKIYSYHCPLLGRDTLVTITKLKQYIPKQNVFMIPHRHDFECQNELTCGAGKFHPASSEFMGVDDSICPPLGKLKADENIEDVLG